MFRHIDPLDKDQRGRFERQIWLTRCVIWLEDLWLVAWPGLAIAGVFTCLAFVGVFLHVPVVIHLMILLTGLLASTGLLGRALRRTPWPSRKLALRRLEREARLAHRPLGVFEDELVTDSGKTGVEVLWERHVRQAKTVLPKLSVPVPESTLYRRDPWVLRYALVLALIYTAVIAGPQAPARLAHALAPDVTSLVPVRMRSVSIWITPPEYTREGPRFLSYVSGEETSQAILDVPEGSHLLAQLEGDRIGNARLVMDGTRQDFETVGENISRFELEGLEVVQTLSVSVGGDVLGPWKLNVIPDQPPVITLINLPKEESRGRLLLEFEAEDDYGIAGMKLDMVLAGEDDSRDSISEPLPHFDKSEKRIEEESAHYDFSAHEWAGRDVLMTLSITDSKGQGYATAPEQFTLPERTFNNPVAAGIVRLRKTLFRPFEDDAKRVQLGLAPILGSPDSVGGDIGAYMALNMAWNRLGAEDAYDDKQLDLVRNLMWDAAIAIEEGQASLALRDLESLREELADALERGASGTEIERLTQQLQQALERYMDAVAQSMEGLEGLDPGSFDPQARGISESDLHDMLEQAAELARTGATEAAQRLLEEFNNILSNMQNAPPPDPQLAQSGRELLDELQRIQKDQQEMMDRTFRRAQNPFRTLENENEALDDTTLQQDLAEDLGDVTERLRELMGLAPANLPLARAFMEAASRLIAEGNDPAALPEQTQALEALRDGLQQSAQRLMQSMGVSGGNQSRPGNVDPFGRGAEGSIGGGVEIPTVSETKRAREIMRELHRRAGQNARPEAEINYIERLLEQ